MNSFDNGESSGIELPVEVIHFSTDQGLMKKKKATKSRKQQSNNFKGARWNIKSHPNSLNPRVELLTPQGLSKPLEMINMKH